MKRGSSSLIIVFATVVIMITVAIYFVGVRPRYASSAEYAAEDATNSKEELRNEAASAKASRVADDGAPVVEEMMSPEQAQALETHLIDGYDALRDEDYNSARVEFVEITKLQPDNPQYWKQLAYIDLNLGDDEEAIKSFEKARALDPEDEIIQQELDQLTLDGPLSEGYDALCSQDFDLAKDAFTTAVELKPDRADLWVQLAFIEDQLGNTEAAKAAFQEALKLDPVNTAAKEATERLNLNDDLAKGYEALKREDFASARDIFSDAVERAPDRSDLWRQLGYIDENLGNEESAREAFARAEEISNDKTLALRDKLDALLKDAYISLCEQNFAAARISYEAAVKLEPERADLWRQLGYVETNLGNKSAAQAAYAKAEELSGN